MKNTLLLSILMIIIFFTTVVFAQDVSDYLILQDIALYKLDKPEKMLPGEPPSGGPRTYNGDGITAGADHFSLDHSDKTYEVMYLGGDANPSPTVQVTQHAGSDSDKWLLHEMDKSFRTSIGVPGDAYAMRVLDGYTIMTYGSGGWTYRWLSGNKVIQIEYTDLMMEQLEPLEAVKAYLVKHPSTLPTMTSEDLRTSDSKTKWIKDEMDRRLWLCDKWFEQLQLQKTDQKMTLEEVVKSMNVFLDYREKYYGVKAAGEKNLLAGYLSTSSETNIKAKLQEYKTWWSANKTGSLIGLLTACPHRLWGQMSLFFGKLGSFFSSLLHRLMG